MLRVLPPSNQTCLVTNQLVAGCEKLLQRRDCNSTFATKSVHVARFTDPRRNSRVWRDSRVILANQTSVFTQPASTCFAARQVWTWVVKRAGSLFNSFCSSVLKHVARFSCPPCRSFTTELSDNDPYYLYEALLFCVHATILAPTRRAWCFSRAFNFSHH